MSRQDQKYKEVLNELTVEDEMELFTCDEPGIGYQHK